MAIRKMQDTGSHSGASQSTVDVKANLEVESFPF